MQSFNMALKSISGNRMRSFLTMLGIIIGVLAIVVLVAIAQGSSSYVTSTASKAWGPTCSPSACAPGGTTP